MRIPRTCLAVLLAFGGCSGSDVPTVDLGVEARAAWEGVSLPAGMLDAEPALDLVVLSIDTLRADRLPSYGGAAATTGDAAEPFTLAWLAAQSTLWEQAWAPSGKTLPSLASFWTGHPPLEHGAVDNRTPVQLPTRIMALKDDGWSTHAVVANRTLTPPVRLPRGFDSYAIRARENEPRLAEKLLEGTAGPVAAGDRLLAWAHFMAPHQPYLPKEEHRRALVSDEALAALDPTLGEVGGNEMLAALHRDPARADATTVATIRGLYDAEILTANDYLQAFLSGLDAQYREAGRGGLLDNAVVIFFSDHGEELADHQGYFMHAKSLYVGTIHVPLMVAGGGWEAGARIAAPIALEDVLAMVLDGERPARELFVATWKDRFYVLRDGPWTLVHNPAGDRMGPVEPPQDVPFVYPEVSLFHRGDDPFEQRDRAAEEPDRTRAMLDAMRAWYLGLERIEGEEVAVDEQMMEELGYVGGQVPVGVGVQPWSGKRWKP
jgi:hypothetical protein